VGAAARVDRAERVSLAALLVAAGLAPPAGVVVLPPTGPGGSAPGWIGAAVEETLPRALQRAGAPALAASDRRRVLETLGITGPVASHATGIRVVEAVGARLLVFGSWDLAGTELTITLRPLDTGAAALGTELKAAGPLDSLGRLIEELARNLAGASGPKAREEPVLAAAAVPFAALRALGEALIARDAETRIQGLRRALAVHPRYPDATLVLARLLHDTGRFADAREALATLPPGPPFAREARFLDGACLLGLGRAEDADVLYADLAAQDPTAGVLANRAVARLRLMPAASGASTLLRQALDRAPYAADLPFGLGWALFVEGDFEGALTWLRTAVRYAPGDAKARIALSWALRRSNHAEEADEQWRAAAALDASLEAQRLGGPAQRLERVLPSEAALVIDTARAQDARGETRRGNGRR
jgi:Flp pilus assembly protein TadD